MDLDSDLALRLSFENSLKYQRALRDLVEQLKEEDRPLNDKAERDKFFDLVDRSCFGLEHFVDATFKVEASGGGVAMWAGSLTRFIQTVAYLDGPLTFRTEYGMEGTVQLKDVWSHVLDRLADAFSMARERATSISPERPVHKRTPGRPTWKS